MTKGNGMRLIIIFVVILFSCFLYKPQLSPLNSFSEEKAYRVVESEVLNGTRIDYYDLDGNPIAPFGNYTSVELSFDDKGRIVTEMYYEGDVQVVSSRGQYGVRYFYNEDNKQDTIIYLDQEGNPMICDLGFSKIVRTFYNNGNIKDEMYFNIQGEQVKLEAGQYGIRHILNSVFWLNQNGEIIFDFHFFINQNGWLVVAVGILLCIFFTIAPKKVSVFVTLFFLIFILSQTLLERAEVAGNVNIKLDFLWSYKQLLTNYTLRVQILNNIWLFIPFGAGVYAILRKPRYLFIPFFLSVSIEAAQYLGNLGLCEFDDVFSNGVGGIIGFLMASEIEKISSRIHNSLTHCEKASLM